MKRPTPEWVENSKNGQLIERFKQMIGMAKPVRRQTGSTYKHYRKQIVVELFNDTIALRLKKTRKRYEIPVTHLLDYLCRREAFRIQMERAKKRKEARKRK